MNQKPNNPKKKKPILATPTPVPPRDVIPMYDPQTGEPNPHYEELTGNKNPLLELRKNSNNLGYMPVQYEPKRKNRWVVRFPEHFKIESWCVSKTKRPSCTITEKKFLCFSLGVNIEWDKITLEFIDPIQPSVSKSLTDIIQNNLNKRFDYKLEMLDPTGVVVETWEIKDCKIESINLGRLDYSESGLATCQMTIKPRTVNLIK